MFRQGYDSKCTFCPYKRKADDYDRIQEANRIANKDEGYLTVEQIVTKTFIKK